MPMLSDLGRSVHISRKQCDPMFIKVLTKYNVQGIAGDTNPLAQDYLVWANTELGNFMTNELCE